MTCDPFSSTPDKAAAERAAPPGRVKGDPPVLTGNGRGPRAHDETFVSPRSGRVRLEPFPPLGVPHEGHDRFDVFIGEAFDDRHGAERPVMGNHSSPDGEEKRSICMVARFVDFRKVRGSPLGSPQIDPMAGRTRRRVQFGARSH